jgi:hypothetical protein
VNQNNQQPRKKFIHKSPLPVGLLKKNSYSRLQKDFS